MLPNDGSATPWPHAEDKKVKGIFVSLIPLIVIIGCSIGDGVPSGAVEGVLDVTVGMGSFDPNRGRTFTPIISVRLEEGTYPLTPVEGATVIGLEGQDLLFMNGANILVRGEVKNGQFMADYVKFLDAGDQGAVKLGVPAPTASAGSEPMPTVAESIEPASPLPEPAESPEMDAPPGSDPDQE